MSHAHRSAEVDKVLAEHEEVKETISVLRKYLGANRPEPGTVEAHDWAAKLAQQLLDLHGRLYAHFRREEETGVLQELAEHFPHAAGEIDRLVADHQEMLDGLREATVAAMSYSEGKRTSGIRLRGCVAGILEQLEAHEEAENELITKLYYEDVGGME